eukprot:CAMPEP_0182428408 /NCGR_PEP_ID=MMETSP1167-20130531/22911_1 /TAXON_ID=2988 /ORGANISM="Mallomonas Sp, Strain CCMP3275" /LENGTH=249 /DNA_ID=CAMNT_0024611311 /DNA_START=185 /DNA_END=931 /DNA_ORIENTATION=-
MGDEGKNDNWRQFNGTELGGLMNQLYGNDRPKINYPKPKKKETPALPTGPFIAGNNPTASDPRKASKQNVKVAVPKPSSGGSYRRFSEVECIPKRKSESVIKQEIDDIKMREMYYRPAYSKPISTESEKNRLSQVCEYKGGKALPAELIAPSRDTPEELLQKKKENERLEQIRQKRLGNKSNSSSYTVGYRRKELSPKEQLAQQISLEIDERREYMQEMLKIGSLHAAEEAKLTAEIKSRIQEITRLEN